MTFENRTFRLTVLSPLHVGCDHAYDPTSFVVKENDGVLVSFDPFRFLETLESEDVVKFSTICRQGTVESLLDVYRFIHEKGQEMAGVKVGVSKDFLKHYRSVLEMPRHLVKKELNSFTLNRTAFNPLKENVYIPGSALKGSLRTALLNLRHKRKPQSGNFTQGGGNRELQKMILDGGQFATDPFSRVKVSDFRPVDTLQRRIVYAVNCKKKPDKGESGALYQIFEVIMPGAQFEGNVSIEKPHSQAGIENPVTFDEVEAALATFFGNEREREAEEAARIGVGYGFDAGGGKMLMRLGRHSGAECVTIEGQRNIRIMTGRGRPPSFLDRATTIWFASAFRKPKSKDDLLPFGWVGLHLASEQEMQEAKVFEKEERDRLEAQQESVRRKREEAQRIKEEIRERQEKAELERQKAEAEARKYPWRPWLKKLEKITDWGMLRQMVFDNEETVAWREVDEFTEAVAEAAERVRQTRPDKWDSQRDELTAKWLEPSGKRWLRAEEHTDETGQQSDSELMRRIAEYKDWGSFKQDPLSYDELDLAAASALIERFREWGCDAKKAKKDKKKAWQALQTKIKKLKQI